MPQKKVVDALAIRLGVHAQNANIAIAGDLARLGIPVPVSLAAGRRACAGASIDTVMGSIHEKWRLAGWLN
jgi:hypothetical protein